MNKIALVVLMSFRLISMAQNVTEPVNSPKEWSQKTEPFRIAGNLYYVGTYDLASYLVVTNQGNILINTGLANSLPIIKENIKSLGFDYKAIKILLLTQAHFDHLGAMADIKKETGAKLFVDEKDANELKTGGKSDYELGKYGVTFKPVTPDRLLKDNEQIKLGSTIITMLHHPGHTKGSCSFLFNTKDGTSTYKVLIANFPSVIVDRKFSEIKDYPNIERDYIQTFKAMKNIDFNLWVASHASQFNLHDKRKPGAVYNPKVFMNKNEYFEKINELEKSFLKKVSE
ncbi:subclass B3 metallo-beta-lactamase [Pedobacter agri]|uniref:subclass B3 metallo-beta-lactamase n=1 Tax=Pedobacter agri TaxID=454586 RepID=UPI002784A924|nr:subclass B3 metallo-beta-lactamase [Pedobacter agri]MDQ1138865.1 glyoxylase-like metal-dependent hydrolase (beta-lactamase superfamily II) [Pedobacter agri]